MYVAILVDYFSLVSQVVWFHSLVTQPRVCVRDLKDNHFSIPLDYPRPVYPVDEKGKSKYIPLNTLTLIKHIYMFAALNIRISDRLF